MKENSNAKENLYQELGSYSKKYTSKKLLKDPLTKYLFCVLLSLFALFLSPYLSQFGDKSPFYIFFITIVALSTVVAGSKPAILTTAFIALGTFLQSITSTDPLYTQTAFFVAGSFAVIFLVDWALKASEVDKLVKQEKIYAEAFIRLSDDLTKAKEQIKARDEFLSVVSHELRTPLTTMLLKLHNMLNNIRSVSLANFSVQELMKVLKNSEIQIKRLTVMINDLLDISLITTGRMELNMKKTDLILVARRVVENFSQMLRENKSEIKIEAPHPVVGNFDNLRIEQAITNLISNAIKYGEKRPIKIQIFSKGNTANFVIKDEGIGIPAKDHNIIFDLFKRSNWLKENSNGLGVGLYICNQIAIAHKGKLKISSQPLKGSTFTLELPLKSS